MPADEQRGHTSGWDVGQAEHLDGQRRGRSLQHCPLLVHDGPHPAPGSVADYHVALGVGGGGRRWQAPAPTADEPEDVGAWLQNAWCRESQLLDAIHAKGTPMAETLRETP